MRFHIENFLPYLLNRAAEDTGLSFQEIYKSRYGMLRHEWRVLFHLGYYDKLTASQICEIGGLHKTKVSRALRALEDKKFVTRTAQDADRRFATVSLTQGGSRVYDDLCQEAATFHERLMADFSEAEKTLLIESLRRLKGQSFVGTS